MHTKQHVDIGNFAATDAQSSSPDILTDYEFSHFVNIHIMAEAVLVQGFARNTDLSSFGLSIPPKDVLGLCFAFYFDADDQRQHRLEWNVRNIKKIKNNVPSFCMKQCRFTLNVQSSPSGLYCLLLRLTRHPPQIERVTVYFEMKAMGNNDRVTFSNMDCVSFHFDCIKTAFKRIVNTKTRSTSSDYAKLATKQEMAPSFSVQLFAKIQRLELNNQDFIDFDSNPKLFSKMKYKWNLSESSPTYSISEKFNDDCWCLVYDERMESEPNYELRLLSLPNGVSRIRVKLAMNVTTNKRKKRRKQKLHSSKQHAAHTFSFQHNHFEWISQCKMLNLSSTWNTKQTIKTNANH